MGPRDRVMGRLYAARRRMSYVWDTMMPYRRPFIVLVHATLIGLAYYMTFLLRFDFDVPPAAWETFRRTLPALVVIRVAVFALFGVHQGFWRYISLRDLFAILQAVGIGTVGFGVVAPLLVTRVPRSIIVLEAIICLGVMCGVRLAVRGLREGFWKMHRSERALIVGAGDAGELLIREIERSSIVGYHAVVFVDDDPKKRGRRIHGVPVAGTVDDIPRLCALRGIHRILIAVPSATRVQRRRMLEACMRSGVAFKSVPALGELVQGKTAIGQLQDVTAEDLLLGREAIRLDINKLRYELQGRRVLVTGAAGSIGSELCRQIAVFEPEMLLLFDRAESGLYHLDLELRRAWPSLKIVPLVGDIVDRLRVDEVMRAYSPDLVYHAAAYKHVPLMQDHPLEAIANNVFGTESVFLAARARGVQKFILISTDKAVRPVGVMGMTKRVAEGLVHVAGTAGATSFTAVRFGNVLGSVGSVLPLFRWQITQGGPITVTDAEATRYFMLVSEAAQLVLQAGAIGCDGDVFFLDMGAPVNILDLAHKLLRLSGLEPGKDIEVQVTGLRPGERQNEELMVEGETLLPSEHEKVFVVRKGTVAREHFERDLEALRRLVALRDREGAVAQIQAMAARY